MSIALKPRTPLRLPEENPLITALKTRLEGFKKESAKIFDAFIVRFKASEQRIDDKLKEVDLTLERVKDLKKGDRGKDGISPTLEEIQALIPSPIEGKQGERGEKGDKGDRGEAGQVGPQGEKGDRGKDGQSAEIQTKQQFVAIIKPLLDEQSPDEIRNKLLKLTIPWIPVDMIIGLSDKIRNLMPDTTKIKFGGGGSAATSTGGFSTLQATEIPNSVRTQFTFASATAQPTYIRSDNVLMKAVSSSGTVNWTWDGSTIATMTVAPQDDIEAVV